MALHSILPQSTVHNKYSVVHKNEYNDLIALK